MTLPLSVVVPTFNNRTLSLRKLRELDAFLAPHYSDYEIVCVEDGSVAAERLPSGELPPRVRLITLPVNRGKGRAVREGMSAARGRTRVFTDIDLPYDLTFILHAERLVRTGVVDFVGGDRTHPLSRLDVRPPWVRRVVSAVLAKAVYLLFVGGVFDSQCGIKAFSDRLAEALFPLLRIDRFSFDIELYYLLSKYRIPVFRAPVRLVNSESSTIRPFRDGIRAAVDLLGIPVRWYRGEYRSAALQRLVASEYWADEER